MDAEENCEILPGEEQLSPTTIDIAGQSISVPDQGDTAWRDDYVDHFQKVSLAITTTSGQLQTNIDAISGELTATSGTFTESLTVSGFPVSTGTGGAGSGAQLGSVILSFPIPGDKVMLFYVDGDQGDVTFDRMTVLVTGTSSPVVDWNVHAGAVFGTETEDVFTVDKITSNTTIGETITSFDSATIGGASDRWCWLEVVNTSGTVEAFNFSAWQTSNIV